MDVLMVGCGVGGHGRGAMKSNNNTNPDNQPHQNPIASPRQAKTPPARTDEAGYQKLPHAYRPLAGRAQRDPLDYDSHPYPSMRRFAEFLALRFDTARTRHSYYRQMRLVHEFCACDPLTITEERVRYYILHVKTMPFAASTGLETCIKPHAAAKSTPGTTERDTQTTAHPASRPLQTAALQTQKA
jgi:hypothetical protein